MYNCCKTIRDLKAALTCTIYIIAIAGVSYSSYRVYGAVTNQLEHIGYATKEVGKAAKSVEIEVGRAAISVFSPTPRC